LVYSAVAHRESTGGDARFLNATREGIMATKKTPDEKSKTEKADKKLQIKDLAGKELDKQVIERVKGGRPLVICYSSRAKTMPW
jgi:hypothetical protein